MRLLPFFITGELLSQFVAWTMKQPHSSCHPWSFQWSHLKVNDAWRGSNAASFLRAFHEIPLPCLCFLASWRKYLVILLGSLFAGGWRWRQWMFLVGSYGDDCIIIGLERVDFFDRGWGHCHHFLVVGRLLGSYIDWLLKSWMRTIRTAACNDQG